MPISRRAICGRGRDAQSTDICVPVSRLAEAVVRGRDKAAELGLMAPVVGHVGDGNFHMLSLFDAGDPAQVDAVEALGGYLSEMAIAMGGTCTGEHGIGQGKASVSRAGDRQHGPWASWPGSRRQLTRWAS